MIINIGWKTREDHDGKSTRKTKKAGGGLKEIRLLKKDSTYQNILSQAKYTFLGNDSSLYSGILEVNGQEMISFCDNDGIECTYAQYLKSNKLFASRCKTYLVTYEARNEKVKNPESGEIVTVYDLSEVPGSSSQNVDNSVLLDSISIVYSLKEGTSEVYLPGKVSVIERESCRDPGILSLPYENVNPLSYGYSIARIRKGSKTFMDHEPTDNGENVKVTYPSAADADKQVLLHGPEEIHGYDLSDYIIGIVVKNTVSDPVIEWFLDGNLYQSGKNLFVINVLTTGLYYATVQYNDEQYTSDAVCIVQDRGLFRVGHVVNLSGISRNTKHDENQCSSSKEIPQANDIVRISSTDFQIEEEIGKGNYGTVFKGSWLGSLVAIKKLPLSKKGKQTQLNMIKGEIEILSRLRHPNLIQIMAYCIENTKAMILMEFIEGSNLEDLIFPDEKPKIDLTEEFKLSVLLQISRGLAYLHGQKPPIIHQDIKPSNILVSHNLVVKICDLGVSRIRTMQTKAAASTLKSIAGTPVYMAPECLLKETQSTTSSDIWSLGCTAIELYTGHDVWDVETYENDDSDVQKLTDLLKERKKPHALEHVPSTMPQQLLDLIRRCLSYTQSERPCAEEMIEKINHYNSKCGRCLNK